jgi:hypothetical protein
MAKKGSKFAKPYSLKHHELAGEWSSEKDKQEYCEMLDRFASAAAQTLVSRVKKYSDEAATELANLTPEDTAPTQTIQRKNGHNRPAVMGDGRTAYAGASYADYEPVSTAGAYLHMYLDSAVRSFDELLLAIADLKQFGAPDFLISNLADAALVAGRFEALAMAAKREFIIEQRERIDAHPKEFTKTHWAVVSKRMRDFKSKHPRKIKRAEVVRDEVLEIVAGKSPDGWGPEELKLFKDVKVPGLPRFRNATVG